MREKLRNPQKYPNPNEWSGNLFDMPTPLGKLGDLTRADLLTLAEVERELANLARRKAETLTRSALGQT